MTAFVRVAVLLTSLGLSACQRSPDDPVTAADLTSNGCLRAQYARVVSDGQRWTVAGYVDFGNLYGDGAVHASLGNLWSGASRDASTWRFDLKAHEDDATGHGFAVWVRTDPERERLLRRFEDDARSGRATHVQVTGTVHTFDAHGNFASRRCVEFDVARASDIVVLS